MTGAKPKALEHASFSLERAFKASPSRVFRCWSDPEAYFRWFVSGEGWEIADYVQDFRIGGHDHGHFRHSSGAATYSNRGWYLDIVPDVRIVTAYTMEADGKPISHSLATIELFSEGSGTRLRFTEQAAFLEGGDGAANRKEGWIQLFGKLETELATH